MRPVNLIPARGAARRATRRCAPGPSPYRDRRAGRRLLARSDRAGPDRQPDLRKTRRKSPSCSGKTRPRKRTRKRLAAYTQFARLREQRVCDGHQPRRQPFRLGTGDARTLAGPSPRRLADQPDRAPRAPGGQLGTDPARRIGLPRPAGLDPRPGARTHRLRRQGRTRSPASSPPSRTSTASPGSGSSPRTARSGNRRRAAAVRSSANEGGQDCRTRNFIAKFQIVVAFDAAPIVPSPSRRRCRCRRPRKRRSTTSTETTSSSEAEELGGGLR